MKRASVNELAVSLSTILCHFMYSLPPSAWTVFLVTHVCICPQSGASLALRLWADLAWGGARLSECSSFWWNLHRSGEGDGDTLHAACPVLVGDKWVRPALGMGKG